MRFNRPHAFTIVEVTAAAAILAVCLSALVPTILLITNHRRQGVLHDQALQAADNLLERVLALPWDDLRGELPDEVVRAEELLEALPRGSWRLAISDLPGTLPVKRATVAVSYATRGQVGSVRLSGWSFRHVPSGEDVNR